MANPQIKERSQRRLTVAFKDSADAPISPSTVRWRLDCVTTQTEVLTWRTASAVASQVIEVPASANVIVNNANAIETKRVTVQGNYGTDNQLNQTYDYDVLNNEFYT